MSLPRSSSGNGTTQACAVCKYQRRKCAPDCILAPYFPHDRRRQFHNAHKLFGVSNITKIIKNLSPADKDEAMRTIIFQSDVRANDPVGGCYRIIRDLQHQIEYSKAELELVLQQISICRAQAAQQQQQQTHFEVQEMDASTNPSLDMYDPVMQYHYGAVQSNQDDHHQQVVAVAHNESNQHLQQQEDVDVDVNINVWTSVQDSCVSSSSTASSQNKQPGYVSDQSDHDHDHIIKPLLDANDLKFETGECVQQRFSTQLLISS